MLHLKTCSWSNRIFFCAASVLLMLPLSTLAQKGYISIGDEVTYGLNVLNRGIVLNTLECQVRSGGSIISYSPSDIKEYGTGRNLVYKSFVVDSMKPGVRYFLERVSVNPHLYTLRLSGSPAEFYYVPGDSMVLKKLPSSIRDFREFLKPLLADCEYVNSNIPYLQPRKKQLSRFIGDAGYCPEKPFPRIRYAMTAGYVLETISQDMSAVMPGVPGKIRIQMATAGAFADLPLYPGDFSFTGGLLFRKGAFSRTTFDSDSRYVLDVEYSSLTLPLNLKYSYLSRAYGLYLEAGPLLSLTTGEKSLIYRTDFCELCFDRTVTLDTDLVELLMPGFGAGAGTVLGYGSRLSWFAGINYYQSFHLISMRKYFNFGDLVISTGIMF